MINEASWRSVTKLDTLLKQRRAIMLFGAMSIEEIVAKVSKSESQLWDELASRVEIEILKWRGVRPIHDVMFQLISAHSFRISFVDTFVAVRRKPRLVCWTHARTCERGDNIRPKSSTGYMELAMD